MDSAGSRREIGVSPFADSADSSSPSNVLFESTSGGILDFFLDSDEEERIGMSRVVADPDSDDEVFAEIIFRGKSISGDGVVFVDQLPDDEIVDPRVKVETITESAASPPRSRRKHLGVRSDDFLWDKQMYLPNHALLLRLLLLNLLPCHPCDGLCRSALESERADAVLKYRDAVALRTETASCRDPDAVFSVCKEMSSRILVLLASPEQTATGKDVSNPLYGCDGLPKTVRVFQFTLDSRSEKLDWFLLHQDWKLLFFDDATSFDSAVHRVHAVSFDAAVLDAAATVSAACIIAAGYIVSAGICDAAGSSVLAVFINIC
ncbi:hypothetical protein Tco_0875546 [Tanacetum coccineum]|uniref:Uncharacterized protein n=1 Tax=Tanacetum coccineum TaxID=301880 RepID=A0ABQ5BPR9_9ASTR